MIKSENDKKVKALEAQELAQKEDVGKTKRFQFLNKNQKRTVLDTLSEDFSEFLAKNKNLYNKDKITIFAEFLQDLADSGRGDVLEKFKQINGGRELMREDISNLELSYDFAVENISKSK